MALRLCGGGQAGHGIVKEMDSTGRNAAAALTQKLDHHLPEIRRRALENLCFKLSNKLLSPSDFRDAACSRPLIGVILRDSEDVNTRASALEILLLISDDNFTAQTVSVCLDAASLKDCDVGGPDLLRCQFRKLVDKLAEHSAESQNIAPKVPTASSSSTLSWVPAAGGTCGLQEKATNDETDRSTDGGHYTGSIVSQSVRQDKVLQGKLLQDSIPLCTHEGQQPSRGTPSLPALPPSLLFSAPPQATQVDAKRSATPSSPPAPSPSLSRSSSVAVRASFSQQQKQKSQQHVASTYHRLEAPVGGLLTKLKSRAAASMLGGHIDSQVKSKLNAVPSTQDHLPSAHMGPNNFNLHSSGEPHTAMQLVSPNTGVATSISAPSGSSGLASSGSTYFAARPALLQSSAQLALPSAPVKAPQSGPLFQAMLEQSTSDRAMQFAREESLALATVHAAASVSAVASVRIRHNPAENDISTGEGRNTVLRKRRMPPGAAEDEADVQPRMLPRVDLTAADEEALFGLTVRFQYAESELEVITVLQELAFCTVLDVLPAALLQRTTLLDTVLETMTSASASDTARHLATHFLHSLVIQTKQALLQADDPEQCPLYDAFDGPGSTGDLHAEEEQLLKSYPQPAAAHKLPRWREYTSAQLVDVDTCFHIICVRATSMLSNTGQILCCALSLIEALFPLLRLESSAARTPSVCERIKEYMNGLAESLEVHIVPAVTHFGSSDNTAVAVELAMNQPLLLKHSGIEVSALIVRFLLCVPVSESNDVVPPQLQLRLAQLWCNPLMDIVAPSWRTCVEPYLSELAPHCARANSVAVYAVQAVESAKTMQKEAEGVLDGAVPLSVWLEQVPLALMATAFTPHKELVHTIMQTVVGAVAKQMENGQGGSSLMHVASDMVQTLLQHPVATVAEKAWSVVRQLLHQLPCNSEQHRAFIQLLTNDSCMRFIFGSMLPSGEDEKSENAVQLLAAVVSSEEQAVVEAFGRWRPWLECYLSNSSLRHLSQRHQGDFPPDGHPDTMSRSHWDDLTVLLQRLYSKKSRKVCNDAAKRLHSYVCVHAEVEEKIQEDPFRGLLDASTAMALADPDQEGRSDDLNMSDVHNLMACVCNTSLPDAVRSSALQRLSTESQEPVFLSAVAVPSFLEEVLQCVEGCAAGFVDRSSAPHAESLVAIHSVQLCAHSLFLLGSLCCRSHGVLTWILGQRHRVIALLPLVFHPITMARRGMAVFLSPIVFLPAVNLMAQESQINSLKSEPTLSITLFSVFDEFYHLPLRVVELQLDVTQHCSAATEVPAREPSASCQDTVQFLRHEKHEVVQLIFFLLSAGKLVDDCCADLSGKESAPCSSKESQLRAMQKCAALLQDLPSDVYLSQDCRQQLLAFLQEVAPLGRLDIVQQQLDGRGGAARAFLLELCQSGSGAQLACGLEGTIATFLNAVMTTPAQVSELAEWDAWIASLGQLLASHAVPGSLLLQLVETAVPATVSLLARWSHATSTTTAQYKGNELPQDDQDSLHLIALPSQQEHHHAQPVLVATLHFLAVLLQEACIKCTVRQQVCILELMSGVDFIGLLLNSVLANTRLPRASHYAAGGCLCELVRMLNGIVSFTCNVDSEDGDVPSGSVEPCIESLQQSLSGLLQHIIRQIGMPAQHFEAGAFAGRHMLRMGMRVLLSICRILPSEKWSQAWVSAVGVFWLTKQLKSVDLHVRCQAAQLLCIVAHPASLQMQSTILQAWPEGGTLMMRHGLSRRQPPAFSAAALTFTANSMASSTVDVPVPENHKAATAGVTEFGCEAVLSREYLWEGLLARMPACGRSPVLACSICMLLRLHASCSPDDTVELLRRQGMPLDVLLQHLDIRQQLATFDTVDAGECNDHCYDGSGFISVVSQMRTGASSADCLPLLCQQSEANEELEPKQYHFDMGHASGRFRRTAELQCCHPRTRALSQGTQVYRDAYGYKLLFDAGSRVTVSAIHSAEHVSAILNCILASTKSEQLTVDKVRMLELALCSIALVCPAAACAFAPHMSTAAQENSTAAAAAAVEIMQCACSLLRHVSMSGEEMQDVLSHVKSYARIDLSVAIAHVLRPDQQVPHRLRGATGSLLHCMLGSPKYVQPFLHSCQDKSEHSCPAALVDAGAATSTIPVGQALVVGLLPHTRLLQPRLALTDVGRSGSQCRHSTNRTPLIPDTRNVLESLLSQSAAATAFAVARGLHLSWADNVTAAIQGLGSTDQAQMAVNRHATQKSANCASSSEAVAWLSLLRAVAHRDAEAMSSIAQTGVIEAIHTYWTRVCGNAGVLREVIMLLSTLVSDSFDARHIISTASQPPLLVMISRLLHQDGNSGMQAAVCQLLCNYASALDGTLTLLKSQIIPEASKALQAALVRHDDALADRILKMFSAITSHSAGQRQLMRVQGVPPFLEIAADLPMQRMPHTSTSLLLLLRNLAFLSDNKAYFLADPRILKLLARQCAAAEQSPHNAAYAMSALWALLHKGERIKATLKGIPDVTASIQACANACEKILQEARSSGATVSKLETLQQLQQSSQVVCRALALEVQKTDSL